MGTFCIGVDPMVGIRVEIPMPSSTNVKKNLFEDLGKPTLRGIRKCPRCGAFNGTRGISCKNKSCNLIFRQSKKKPPGSLDATKIIMVPDSQVYSVKIRDRGRDCRGFVQLPLIEGLDPLEEGSGSDIVSLIQMTSQCFIDSCPRSKEECSEKKTAYTSACKHINSAILSMERATPLYLSESVIDSLPIEVEIKNELSLLLSDTSSPLVQRVSKNAMVVRCSKANEKYPLTYVHTHFYNLNSSTEAVVVCQCETEEVVKPVSWRLNQSCIHYHACVCAFLSDKKLREEFRNFIDTDRSLTDFSCLTELQNNEEEEEVDEFYEQPSISSRIIRIRSNQNSGNLDDEEPANKKMHKDDTSTVLCKPCSPMKKSLPPIRKTGCAAVDEDSATFSFMSWLGSVTERINQTMHFQFPGKPDPLVFHIPQIFFDCFQQRISTTSTKKRLPNSTTTFSRDNAVPLGTFTKYTWHINSIVHVKQIFNTPEVPLQVTRNFLENRDGTYDYYEPDKSDNKELTELFKKTNDKPLIKPLELQTFLKVGNVSSSSKDTTAFTIEWIPNILPRSSIGELRLIFEYGHLKNGRIEIPPCNRVQLLKS